jgi:hypothetical protein
LRQLDLHDDPDRTQGNNGIETSIEASPSKPESKEFTPKQFSLEKH